jgi:hypothetical protein
MSRIASLLICLLAFTGLTGRAVGEEHSGMAEESLLPVGTPSTFDVGINRDGFKTYVVHGYSNVSFTNQSGSTKTFSGAISPISGLDVDSVQASIDVTGFSGVSNSSDIKISEVSAESSGKISFSIDLKGRVSVNQIHYLAFVTTKEKSPWPKAIPGPPGDPGPAGPPGPVGGPEIYFCDCAPQGLSLESKCLRSTGGTRNVPRRAESVPCTLVGHLGPK